LRRSLCIQVSLKQGGQRVINLAGNPAIDGHTRGLKRRGRPPVDATANDGVYAEFDQPVDSLVRGPVAGSKLLTLWHPAFIDGYHQDGLGAVEPRRDAGRKGGNGDLHGDEPLNPQLMQQACHWPIDE